MPRKILKNKPLVEAIFETRWDLTVHTTGIKVDPHYKIFIGRLYDRIAQDYPFHEQLPTAAMPDEMAGYVVQHRFRKDKGKWPLVQVGPGIVTLNDTDGYVWEDFQRRISRLLDAVFQAYPNSQQNIMVNALLLRYIDAVAFDFDHGDIFSFLKNDLKITVDLHESLFRDTGVSKAPTAFDLRFSFASAKPMGTVHLKFARGKKGEDHGLIWETVVQASGRVAATEKNEIINWVNEAHTLTDDWFFKMIEGELLRRFE